ncbi:MAG: hypothetical protein JW751_27740 [Polyangiaceae bacterium]|nr:hypothetical protein [Polyangiaceae bacterium]
MSLRSAALVLRSAGWPLAAAGTLVSLGLAGCDCDKERGDRIVWLDGTTSGNVYESSPIHGPWLDFPGGRRYRLVHDLGRTPTDLQAFLSSDEDGDELTPSVGNTTLFEGVTDAYVDIHNDSCPDFYLRVVATVPAENDEP